MASEFKITDTGYLTMEGHKTSDPSLVLTYKANDGVEYKPKGSFNIVLNESVNIDKTTTQVFNDNDPKNYMISSSTQLMSVNNDEVTIQGVISPAELITLRSFKRSQGIKLLSGGILDSLAVGGVYGRIETISCRHAPSENKNDFITNIKIILENN